MSVKLHVHYLTTNDQSQPTLDIQHEPGISSAVSGSAISCKIHEHPIQHYKWTVEPYPDSLSCRVDHSGHTKYTEKDIPKLLRVCLGDCFVVQHCGVYETQRNAIITAVTPYRHS